MYLLVAFDALFLYIVFEHLQVSILAHGVEIVPVCPKLSSPQKDFHLGVSDEHFTRGDALNRLHHAGHQCAWRGLYQKMDVVSVNAYFKKPIVVAFSHLHAH